MREHIVVPSIGSREVALAERSGIGHCQDALQPLNFGNGLFSIHPASMIQYETRIGQTEVALLFPERFVEPLKIPGEAVSGGLRQR